MPPSSSFHPTPLTTDEQPQTTVKDSLGTSCSDRDSRSPSPCSSAENCINGRGTDGQSESEPCGDGHPEVVQQTGEMVSRIMTGTTPHDNHTTALNDGGTSYILIVYIETVLFIRLRWFVWIQPCN